MTLTEQVEEVGFASVKAVPTVAAGIGLGILVSIVPVILMAVGLKLTNELFMRVVD